MCLLNACCYCIFLDVGCMIIAATTLLLRILALILTIHQPEYKGLDFSKDLTSEHVTLLLLVVGIIIPIFLMFGVCTANPQCVCTFVAMEILFVIIFTIWQIILISNRADKGGEHKQLDKDKGKEDLSWLPPLISMGLEIYFLWVAYSYYRFLQDVYYYDDYYEPSVFYV